MRSRHFVATCTALDNSVYDDYTRGSVDDVDARVATCAHGRDKLLILAIDCE